MKIEIDRFPDRRLKMVKIYDQENDFNIRVNGKCVSIVPRNAEAELEKDVLEAVNLWNLMFMYPKLREAINAILMRYLAETSTRCLPENAHGILHFLEIRARFIIWDF